MTTKNEILTASIDSVLYLPLDCVQSNDSVTYVYTDHAKQQIIVGPSNENEIIVRDGLKKGEEVYLVPPSDAEDYSYDLLDPSIIEKYKKEEEAKKQKEDMQEPPDKMKHRMKEMGGNDFKVIKDGRGKGHQPPKQNP